MFSLRLLNGFSLSHPAEGGALGGRPIFFGKRVTKRTTQINLQRLADLHTFGSNRKGITILFSVAPERLMLGLILPLK